MVETQRLRLTIVGASCATCVIPIRKALEKTKGVESIGANYVADLIGYRGVITTPPRPHPPPKIIKLGLISG